MRRAGSGIDIEYPFRGRWIARNSPASRVPSHGTTLFATTFAIDFVPVSDAGRTAPLTVGALLRPQAPQEFPGFGRPILAPADGTVLAVRDGEPDHPAFRGLPSIGYALTQRRRALAGWPALAGNSVLIAHDGPDERDDAVIALCHLMQGSVTVVPGQRIRAGDPVGRCGNSGNSTEPHLHIQAMDHTDPERAAAVPLAFRGSLPRNGEIVQA